MLNIFLTNLGKYNEGELCGKWFDLEEYDDLDDFAEQGCFKEIGIGSRRWDGGVYEEWFVTDYDTDIPGLTFSEYPDLETLIELAHRCEGLSEQDKKAVEAYLSLENDDLDTALDVVESGEYVIYDGCMDAKSVARRQYAEGLILFDLPERYSEYIDWDRVADEELGDVYQIGFETFIEFLI